MEGGCSPCAAGGSRPCAWWGLGSGPIDVASGAALTLLWSIGDEKGIRAGDAEEEEEVDGEQGGDRGCDTHDLESGSSCRTAATVEAEPDTEAGAPPPSAAEAADGVGWAVTS